MGKDLLMKLPLQSENVEEEEYFFYCIMKLPLHPKHAEEEKKFFFYICQRIIVCDSAS